MNQVMPDTKGGVEPEGVHGGARPRLRRPRRVDPRTHILDVATPMFAARGFNAVSVRDVTTAAHVNLAAITYYFGSKEGLVEAVVERISRELDVERRQLLDQLMQRSGGVPSLRDLLLAHFKPLLHFRGPNGGQQIALEMFARVFTESEGELRQTIETNLGHMQPTLEALARLRPDMPREEVCWGFHFALGVMRHNMQVHLKRIQHLSDGLCRIDDLDAVAARAAAFAAAGFEGLAALHREQAGG